MAHPRGREDSQIRRLFTRERIARRSVDDAFHRPVPVLHGGLLSPTRRKAAQAATALLRRFRPGSAGRSRARQHASARDERQAGANTLLRPAFRVAIAFSASAVGLLGLAHTGIQASIVEAPLVATVFQVELNRESAETAAETAPETAAPEPIEHLPSTAHLSAPRVEDPHQETIQQLATAGRVLTEDEIKLLARAAGWPEYTLNELLEVAWCESSYNPMAMNGTAIHGLMQVHTLWFNYSGLDRSQWSNALVNLQVALAAYNYDLEQGHAPWTQWQCRPGGIRVPTEEFAPHLPDVPFDDEEAAGESEADEAVEGGAPETPVPGSTPAGNSGDAPPSATPTPAPWDVKPSWPPVAETPTPDSTPPASETPEAAATVAAPGVIVDHQPDAPLESSATVEP